MCVVLLPESLVFSPKNHIISVAAGVGERCCPQLVRLWLEFMKSNGGSVAEWLERRIWNP